MDVVEPAGLHLRLLQTGLKVPSFFIRAVYGIEIPWKAEIGRRVVIAHQGGIVIAPDAVIGDDCLIRQNVTIGMAREGGPSPRIGRGVQIGAGAVIAGDVTVGDGAVIGPNSVVTINVPSRSRVVAAPSRILAGPEANLESEVVKRDGGLAAESSFAEEVASVVRDALDLDGAVGADTPLLSSGVVDSLNLVVVLSALESRYALEIPSDDVSADSFDTPRQIADYLHRQRS